MERCRPSSGATRLVLEDRHTSKLPGDSTLDFEGTPKHRGKGKGGKYRQKEELPVDVRDLCQLALGRAGLSACSGKEWELFGGAGRAPIDEPQEKLDSSWRLQKAFFSKKSINRYVNHRGRARNRRTCFGGVGGVWVCVGVGWAVSVGGRRVSICEKEENRGVREILKRA